MYNHFQQLSLAPIFIFQMGKVGSSSLKSTLNQNYHGLVVHAHNHDMLTDKHKAILRWRRRLRLPIYVICPIREPFSRNISAFFENFNRDTELNYSNEECNSDKLLELFLKHYPHNVCLEWFDRHLRTTFGIDVLSQPFPIRQKWKIYQHESVHLLVYRSDLESGIQLDIISQFIGKKITDWSYKNISSNKEYGSIYKDFLHTVKLPDIYISIFCNSQFCRKFWSAEEIDIIRNKFRYE